MAEIIKMPRLSDTMEEGVVAEWHKKVGDTVKEGEIIADIETDKATQEFESFYDGVVLHIGVETGEAVPVDTLIAIIGKKGEDIDDLLKGGEKTAAIADEETPEKKEKSIAKEKIDTSSIKANLIKMPRLSDTMEEGVVAEWKVKVGDEVKENEPIAEIETDKATQEFISFYTGTVLHIALEEGESVPVETIIAVIGEKGADYEKLIQAHQQESIVTEDLNVEEITTSSNKAGKILATPAKKQSAKTAGGRIRISPLARKMAEEKGYDIEDIEGSGEGGRIIKRDVESYIPTRSTATTTLGISESYEDKNVSQMRKTIGKRLGESKFGAPHFYLTIDLDMDKAIEARKAINSIPDTKVSFNDLVIKAAAAALRKHPDVNSSWMEDKIRTYDYVNIGVAVAVEDGLLVPVVRHADHKQLSTISAEVKDFAQRAKDKKLQPEDWEGSTFSISNLGMFGIEEFTAIINPPNACILAVGAIRQEPVVKDGEIVVGNRMKVTLSCDHRVVDGALGAEFLKTFRIYMENPVTILS